jgi:hypothetical protein
VADGVEAGAEGIGGAPQLDQQLYENKRICLEFWQKNRSFQLGSVIRVARWYIFIPKMPILVDFGVEMLVYFMAIWKQCQKKHSHICGRFFYTAALLL